MTERKEGITTFDLPMGRLFHNKYLSYPVKEEERISYYKDGMVQEIVTASTAMEIILNGERIRIEPRVVQSCMNPKNISILPIRIAFFGDGRVEIAQGEEKHIIGQMDEISIQTELFFPELKVKTCHPCSNCGHCSW